MQGARHSRRCSGGIEKLLSSSILGRPFDTPGGAAVVMIASTANHVSKLSEQSSSGGLYKIEQATPALTKVAAGR